METRTTPSPYHAIHRLRHCSLVLRLHRLRKSLFLMKKFQLTWKIISSLTWLYLLNLCSIEQDYLFYWFYFYRLKELPTWYWKNVKTNIRKLCFQSHLKKNQTVWLGNYLVWVWTNFVVIAYRGYVRTMFVVGDWSSSVARACAQHERRYRGRDARPPKKEWSGVDAALADPLM